MKQGLIVTICAPSQGGKDFFMNKFINALNNEGLECKNASVYKMRKHRETDGGYIKSIKSLDDVNILKENQIVFSYGGQLTVYDKKELDHAVENGQIIFIATCIPDLCKYIKKTYGNNDLSIFIRREQPLKEDMLKEENQRHGQKLSPFQKQIYSEIIQDIVCHRSSLYKEMIPKYIDYAGDSEFGADYFLTNWYTFFNGSWNTKIEKKSELEMKNAINEIIAVYNKINSGRLAFWREDQSLLASELDRNKNPLSLHEDFMEYLMEKENENQV